MKEEEILIDVLTNKNPVLFLGAGFSLGAKNKEGKELPTASPLAKELYDEVLKTALTDMEKRKFFSDENKFFDLKYICNIMDLKKLAKERDAFLTECFYGSHCSKEDYHYLIKGYPWRTIFTLNIDDLIENLYEHMINVQLLGGETIGSTACPTLIKLHGSVLRPDLGYVFSDKEYQRYLNQDAWAISAFGTEYYRNDVIFLGTEFQELDLQNIINRFSDAGAVTNAHDYFFVTPEIKDSFLELQISQNSNFHHICMTTEDFLRFLNTKIIIKNSQRKRMRSQGVLFLDELKKEYHQSYLDTGSLYQGNIPQFEDFFGNWDIKYPNFDFWVRYIIDSGLHKIVSFYGEPYVGKSCVAMRMLVDLYNKGYFAFNFSMRIDLDAEKYSILLLEYLSTLPAGTKCAVLAENMAYFYSNLKYIVENCPKNISQLVFIVTANMDEHLTKRYIFDQFDNYEQHLINFTINRKFAENIYGKLSEKNHLNNLMKYADGKNGCIHFIKSINDIIEVLYISQEGRKFSDHFAVWVEKVGDQIALRKAFEILCFFGDLDIYDVPVQFFLRVLATIGIRIQFDDFYKHYKDYLLLEKDMLKVRCLRIINTHVLKNLSEAEKYQIIYSAAGYYAPLLKDRGITIQDRIFQMLIKVKKLTSKKILGNERILQLLVDLESKAQHLSYYWIQRGISQRYLSKFEEANNAFEKAIDVRGSMSYNIEHAQAKNFMAWGLWELQNKKDDALDLFTRGQSILKNLINKILSRYFVYSVHSYTDMMLKYYEVTGGIPNQDELYFINSQLNALSKDKDNHYSSHIITAFKKFCQKNKLKYFGLQEWRSGETDFVDIDDLMGNE